VIFDEVHYINDAERGVVWEEVLIMLPSHVRVIMLSATVPNTKEFAEWVGRTKRKKVYVISTTKRPVPLEHYLYTGNSIETTNELFLVLDAKMEFFTSGYNKAVDAKKQRATKMSQSCGAKGARQNVTPQQDKNIWLSVIDLVRKREELPAIAFTFSLKRIDDLTRNLVSVNLVAGHEEQHRIHSFFERCIGRLKGTDRQLPQVMQIRNLLYQGIGIHHSGILPILKEIVEMLFQKGLVKILFATETFAMGVNMPARTVIFDAMCKFDGVSKRDLQAGEYIQMAGRAGRRGLDKAGTVIVLCKGDVPEMSDLHRMMLGKSVQLQSQFRLTYSMILNLMRVEQLRVEDMIKRSFSEFGSQKDAPRYVQRLKQLEQDISSLPTTVDCTGDMQQFYESCDEYFRLQSTINEKIYSSHVGAKVLCPGRVVVINTRERHSVPAVVLQVKDKNLKVLALCDNNTRPSTAIADNDWVTRLRPVISGQMFLPEGQCSQVVINISLDDLAIVSTKVLKVNVDRILDDVKKREQARFRNDPPGPSTQLATQELLRLVESNVNLPPVDLVGELHLQDLDLVQDVKRFQFLAETLPTYKCISDPSFDDSFQLLHKNTKLKEEYTRLKVLLSDESLALLPEYQQRLKVLQRLGYINAEGVVKLKGRVACELSAGSGHELLITELVFSNAFAELQPAELASVLSSVVFQTSRCSEPTLTPLLAKSRDEFCKMAKSVALLEKECGVPVCVEDYVESLHFGLMEVVYEWARNMPFSTITNLTDVQAGLIVRCIQRLDEALRDICKAACIVGDPVLQRKAEDASCAIKRDIVFAASLYTQ
jgi:antiviral helicase SKI2